MNEQPRRRNRNWVWVFVALAVLGALAIAVNWVYSAAQPLTPEKLHAARELWKQHRPLDYDLKITKAATYVSSDGSSGTAVDKFTLTVRGGKIESFLVNGKEPEPLIAPDGRRNIDEERRQRAYYDIDGLFDAMEEFIELDRRNNTKSFLKAGFDKRDGHLTLFSRQLKGKYVPHILVEMKR